ncbi:MAG TPA: aminotransferase class I/II-fold pyridoxal phosphate-dependent enzyme, partial [Candidatus Limnocylindrales bacterium]
FAIARRETLARIEPYRPPGSVSTISVTVVTRALGDPEVLTANLARVESERGRLADALQAAGWRPEPSVTNFLLVPFHDPAAAAAVATALVARGLVPRTFPADHPLAHCLRLTVRDREQDDRLIAAAESIDLSIELRP